MIPISYVGENGEKQGDMWLMAISLNPGAPLRGSIIEYHPGIFNSTHFKAVGATARVSDFGKDDYVTQWFCGLSNDEVSMRVHALESAWKHMKEDGLPYSNQTVS